MNTTARLPGPIHHEPTELDPPVVPVTPQVFDELRHDPRVVFEFGRDGGPDVAVLPGVAEFVAVLR